MTEKRMWGGRFAEGPDALLLRVNASIHFDHTLVDYDVLGSIAQARMLRHISLVSQDEADALERGLLQVLSQFHAGKIAFDPELEDIHTHVESALRAEAGADTAGKLHTGRSRNDQVALDEALWLREHVGLMRQACLDTAETIAEVADRCADVLIPGVTHLQPAQPLTLGHHLMAHVLPLLRDESRLADLRRRISYCPLGSGALAGSPLPLDRAYVAELLGFEGGPSMNSMDSVSDRDLLVETCQVAALTGTHLSRLAEDLILWATPAFGYVALPEASCTGSSLMPQKRNPDALELVRGKSGRLISAPLRLLTVMKGLPLAYNKDLQEDKEPLFDSVQTLLDVLALVQLTVGGMTAREDRCAEALASFPDMLATDLADYLVHKKIPFRDAHEIAGLAVADAENRGVPLDELSHDDLQAIHIAFDKDIIEWLDAERSVARRSLKGGPFRPLLGDGGLF